MSTETLNSSTSTRKSKPFRPPATCDLGRHQEKGTRRPLRNPLIFERARFRRFSAVRPDAERTNRLTRALISRQRPSKFKNPTELIPYRGHFQSLYLTPGCKTPAAKNEGMAEGLGVIRASAESGALRHHGMFRQLRRRNSRCSPEQGGSQHAIRSLSQDKAAEDVDGQCKSFAGLGELLSEIDRGGL